MWVIEEEKEITFLRRLMSRLYSEDRMSGDTMRDMAQRLDILLDGLIEVEEGDI